jgi:hypothetical protein
MNIALHFVYAADLNDYGGRGHERTVRRKQEMALIPGQTAN